MTRLFEHSHKPWVNQEMDAGLVRKISNESTFIPLRHKLSANLLPPLLSGMLSPEIDEDASDLAKLVNDVYGVSRKPPLGSPPATASLPKTEYSAAATAVAKEFVEASHTAVFGDPQLNVSELSKRTDLAEDDVKDALHELRSMFTLSFENALPKDELFVEFDVHFKGWNPQEDALRLAADLVNDNDFSNQPSVIAERYGWNARRINPAIAYLANRDLILDMRAMGTQPWLMASVQKKNDGATRRFVKSRS